MNGSDAPERQQQETQQLVARASRFAVLLGFTLILVYLCYLLIQPFLGVISWALTLAIIGAPIQQRLERLTRSANVAACINVALLALFSLLMLSAVLVQVTAQATEGVEQVQSKVEEGTWLKAATRSPYVQTALSWIDRNINLQDELEGAAREYFSGVTSLLTGSLWVAVQALMLFFVLFYFLRDREVAVRTIRSLMPLPPEETEELITTVGDSIKGTVYGIVLVSMIQGALSGLMFWALGLPAPLLWGTIMALLSIVPWLGPFIIWVPAAIFLALDGEWGKAMILTAWGTLLVGLIDNLLYPIFIGNKIHLHTLAVFFGVIGGMTVFGASGIILGPTIVAVADALLALLRRRLIRGAAAEPRAAPVNLESPGDIIIRS